MMDLNNERFYLRICFLCIALQQALCFTRHNPLFFASSRNYRHHPSWSAADTNGKRKIAVFAKNAFPLEDRFDRTSPIIDEEWSEECILEIHGISYNLTTWARNHPGGVDILKKFHNKNASQAFESAGHSLHARELLQQFAVNNNGTDEAKEAYSVSATMTQPKILQSWKKKLFTKEDPIGFHKYLGIFCLGHFVFRFYQMLFGDFSCGLGSRMGKGPSLLPALCLVPHALLSLSSLIFDSIPRERVVGKPMIWQEFRWHNIIFGLRSVLTTALAWLSIYGNHTKPLRLFAVISSCAISLASMWLADFASSKRRPSPGESTTATMPYWEGCSMETQKRFKTFYAISQFQATATCMAVGNPAWTLSVLLPIQAASFLMTLVRKGLLSSRGYHMWYSFTLALPYIVGLRSMKYMQNIDFPLFLSASWLLFFLRRRGINKYLLWIPFAVLRCLIGDNLLHYDRPW